MLRLSANLSTLFTELPLLERPAAAASAGFSAIEFQFPYEIPACELAAACRAARVQVVLINVPAGDRAAGELGLAVLPGRQADFRQAVTQAADYAEAIGCRQLNSLAGRRPDQAMQAECWRTLIANTREAAASLPTGRPGRRSGGRASTLSSASRADCEGTTPDAAPDRATTVRRLPMRRPKRHSAEPAVAVRVRAASAAPSRP